MLFSNYKILNEIGKGGMAIVYKAIDNSKNFYALKVLNNKYAQDKTIVLRFQNEAKAMAMLQHPNIVKVYDFISYNGSSAIVMEYIKGLTLSAYIRKYGPLKNDMAFNIMLQILSAIDFAHKHGIIHRDIKPSNIMITKNLSVKIIDFGIAKFTDNNQLLTKTKVAIGTVIYMSPEQIKTPKDIDNLSDIYSLGVLLYYMLSGKHPYNAKELSEFDIQEHIVNKPLAKIESYPDLNRVIEKATQKNAQDRFLSCDQFAQALISLHDTSNNKTPDSFTNTKKILIGRHKEAQIKINEPYISRKHAALYINPDDDKYFIEDLNSTTGTYVNNKRIFGKHRLNENDVIKLGNYALPWKDYMEFDFDNDQDEVVDTGTTNQYDIYDNQDDNNWFYYYKKVLKEYANFDGRACRTEYFSFIFFKTIFYILYSIGIVLILRNTNGILGNINRIILIVLIVLYPIIHFIPSLSVSVRRLHDTGNSGWMFLIPIYSTILLFSPGTFGPNKYGDDPIK